MLNYSQEIKQIEIIYAGSFDRDENIYPDGNILKKDKDRKVNLKHEDMNIFSNKSINHSIIEDIKHKVVNTLKFEQFNTTGTDANRIGFHINTNDNTVHVCQGKTFDNSSDTTCESTTTSEYGGHTVNIDLHSGDTNLKGSQETGTGNADHEARVYTYGGENNDIFFKQSGNGDKFLQLIVRTDNGEQEVIQAGNGDHTATIDLTGSYTTDLSLTQNSGTNQSYTLTNNCQTSSGCSVTVTQN